MNKHSVVCMCIQLFHKRLSLSIVDTGTERDSEYSR